MSEPISGGVAGAVGWKLIGGLAGLGAIGAALATIVVMCMTKPKTDQEWTVGIISTVVSSISGCSAVVIYFNLQHWSQSIFGLLSLGGLFFACGLPGWAFVRWAFNWMNKRQNADLAEVIKDIKGAI